MSGFANVRPPSSGLLRSLDTIAFIFAAVARTASRLVVFSAILTKASLFETKTTSVEIVATCWAMLHSGWSVAALVPSVQLTIRAAQQSGVRVEEDLTR